MLIGVGIVCFVDVVLVWRMVMKSKLKLFIWTDFEPNYSGGLAFAIAKDEADAKKLIREEHGFEIRDWGTLEIRSLCYRFAQSVGGGA